MYALKFTEEGHEIHPAASGVEGLRLLEEVEGVDVVLVDMIMPGMNGLEFIEQAKTLPAAENAKFIVLSNQGQESDIADATKAGAIGYIIKAHSIPSEVVKEVVSYVNKK